MNIVIEITEERDGIRVKMESDFEKTTGLERLVAIKYLDVLQDVTLEEFGIEKEKEYED